MSLISSLRIAGVPALSRRLVSSMCVASISSNATQRKFSKSCGHSTQCCCTAASSLVSSSSLFNSVAPRFFSSSSTSLVAPGNNRLILSKNEALDQLDSEIRELTLPEDPEIQTYIAANGFSLDVTDREVKLTKSDERATVDVRFSLMPDTDDLPGMGQPDQQQQQQEEQQKSGEDQPPKPLKHSFMVQIHTKAAKNNFLHVNCHADEEGRVVIEHLATDEEACKKMFNASEEKDNNPANMNNLDMGLFDSGTAKFINFEDLPDGPAEKLFNLLCDFGVDDRLALFVQQYSYIVRTKQQVDKVKSLADFVAAIP